MGKDPEKLVELVVDPGNCVNPPILLVEPLAIYWNQEAMEWYLKCYDVNVNQWLNVPTRWIRWWAPHKESNSEGV